MSRWATGVNVLFGLWLFFIPTFIWSASGASFWNDIVVGVVVTVLAGFATFAGSSTNATSGSANPNSR